MNKSMKSFIFLFIFGVLFYNTCFADTHTVSSDCSASAIQTAINAASEGDIIDVVCTGTVTWSSPIVLSGGKTLRGGGAKGSSGTNGTWPLIINVTYNGQVYNDALIKVVNDGSQSINRVTGFKFTGTGKPNRLIWCYGKGTGTNGYGAFQIDNNYFDSVTFNSRLIVTNGTTGKLTGLINNNVFYHPYPLSSNNSYINTYKGANETCYGYDSLHRDTGFGTDDFVFWEDNYMLNALVETSDGGGRVVVRYNEMASDYTNGTRGVLDGHGADNYGSKGCGVIAAEFYNNSFTGSSALDFLVYMRGGKWIVHNNTTQSGKLSLMEYRVYRPEYLDWKACSGTWCCETPRCDIQAPTADDFDACYPLPNQVSDTYVWNNLKNGINMTPIPFTETIGIYIAIDRDYWIPSYGTEAALTATCTTGAYYGATDSGKLWKCTATNIWTLQYAPYTYPHPLRTAPQDLRVVLPPK